MNIQQIKAKRMLVSVLLLCMVIMGIFAGSFAYAESDIYTNVLEDLKKDTSFNVEHYPLVKGDYSLNLIQLAESSNKELFVYVYQPSGEAQNLIASSINISITVNDEISFHNYKLKLLNSTGVFYKYIVQDFTVLSEPTRYYAISSIYRPFDKTIDKDAEHDNTITEVNYPINKQYCFSTINGQPYCKAIDIETIVITDKFVGFVRYKNGFQLHIGACDSHFVAFNTDKRIDKLFEADVYYTSQDYSSSVVMGKETQHFGDKLDKYAYLKYTDKVEHTGGGWFAGTYKWDRIETVEQFIDENNITQDVYTGARIDISVANKIDEDGIKGLKGKKWVLRFAETSFNLYTGQGSYSTTTTLVGDVTILRLKFETDGITYNLGVIDNKQTGDDEPINKEDIKIKFKPGGLLKLLSAIIIFLIILLIVFILYKFLKALFGGGKNNVKIVVDSSGAIVSAKDKKKAKKAKKNKEK